MPFTRSALLSVLILALLLITWVAYLPGLSGGFLFDDYPNLDKLGTFGGVTNLENLYSYLKAGFAGPTGRPVSLLSFLINDNNWPSEAGPFKYTNVLIHLLTGLLIFWAGFRLLLQIGRNEADAALIGLVAASIWLLHPYFVSTTLYVVQRMTQLAALFALAGILGYLHGRGLLASRPKAGLAWITLSVVLGTGLAALSKENGALLPVLILVIEWSLARHWVTKGPASWWKLIFLWLPTGATLAYLARPLFGDGILPTRLFTLEERLLTQPRILWEYLSHLLFPRIQTRGLYQDGYEFSTGLLVPWTTLVAILGIVMLVAIALWVRHRFPLVTLAILFFLAGHLVESTTISLELYFEHRNYLPSAFLFLPIAAALVAVRSKARPTIAIIVLVAPVLVLSALTYQRATLWGDTPALLALWAHSSPNSPRAQSSIGQTLHNRGDVLGAIHHLEEASSRLPHSALLSVRLLAHQVTLGIATPDDFERASSLARIQRFDAQTMRALRLLVDVVALRSQNKPWQFEATHALLETFEENPEYGRFGLVTRFVPYLRMGLYLAQGQIEPAVAEGRIVMRRYADTDTALSIVADVAAAGFPKHALELMDDARQIFQQQEPRTLKRPAAVYESEIERLTEVLEEEILHATDLGA